MKPEGALVLTEGRYQHHTGPSGEPCLKPYVSAGAGTRPPLKDPSPFSFLIV